MTDSVFFSMLKRIYLAFGKAHPIHGSAVYTALHRRVVERGVPDVASEHIANKLEDYDSLPVNLGKSLIREFEQWRSMQAVADTPPCPYQCEGGFFYAWAPNGNKWAPYAAPCADCSPANKMAVTRYAIQAKGHHVMPYGYPSGPIGYDRDNKLNALAPLEQSQAGPMAGLGDALQGMVHRAQDEVQEIPF